MIDIVTVIGSLIALTLLAALIPCCPLSVVCPPFCTCTLPLLVMFVTTLAGLSAYWSNSGMMSGGYGTTGMQSFAPSLAT